MHVATVPHPCYWNYVKQYYTYQPYKFDLAISLPSAYVTELTDLLLVASYIMHSKTSGGNSSTSEIKFNVDKVS